jgi:hypothetical protein
MKGLICSFLLALLIPYSGLLLSQDVFEELDRIYGPDPLLFNGKKYTYFMPAGIEGDQYFESAGFVNGEVVVKWVDGKVVSWKSGENGSDFLLNYDIYNQKLLLKFIDETGAEQIIELSEAWLDSFSLENAHFKYVKTDNTSRIYQVLGNNEFRVFYYWRKNLKLNSSSATAHYAFSGPIKARFVFMNGSLKPYGSNSSFTGLFAPDFKDDIRKYLQDHQINMKKANDQAVSDLIDFISNLE